MTISVVWFLTTIILLAALLSLIGFAVKLRQEVKMWTEGRKMYKGNNLCSTCVKHYQISCPRCTLYLMECSYYVSPEQEATWDRSDPYEK